MATTTLYTNATILTINGNREVILDGAILVTGNKIVQVGPSREVESWDLSEDHQVVSLAGRIILPGLINTHAHVGQSLLRGLAEDLPLKSWLCDAVWPLESQYEADDGYTAARLTISEMLLSGTTCFLESMCTHRCGFPNVVKAVGEMGIRACLGKLVKFEESDKELKMVDPRDRDVGEMSVDALTAAWREHDGSFGGRVKVWAAAGTPRGSYIDCHRRLGDACKKHDIPLTMHCAEAPQDLKIFRQKYDCTPMEFCRDANLAGPKTVLAHMVNLDLEKDLSILKATGTKVAHNPNSNLKLASGIAAVPQMLDAGINVSLGTDGAPCGNSYDMFREMHLAGILHKGAHLNASLVGATTVLELATINGARALGLENDIGSIEVGKKADFVVVTPKGLHCAPYDEEQFLDGGLDPMTTVVYSCTAADVEMVVVDGQRLVEDFKLKGGETGEIMHAARIAIKGIRQRSKVSADISPWKYVI